MKNQIFTYKYNIEKYFLIFNLPKYFYKNNDQLIAIQKRIKLKYKYSNLKKKRSTPIYFNTNYHTEIKLIPIIMDHCLLQFDVLKFFLGFCLHGKALSNFNFYFLLPISRESIVFRSNFRSGDFDGFTYFEVP